MEGSNNNYSDDFLNYIGDKEIKAIIKDGKIINIKFCRNNPFYR